MILMVFNKLYAEKGIGGKLQIIVNYQVLPIQL